MRRQVHGCDVHACCCCELRPCNSSQIYVLTIRIDLRPQVFSERIGSWSWEFLGTVQHYDLIFAIPLNGYGTARWVKDLGTGDMDG